MSAQPPIRSHVGFKLKNFLPHVCSLKFIRANFNTIIFAVWLTEEFYSRINITLQLLTMDLNLLLFPAPRCSYSVGKVCGELIWVPKDGFQESNSNSRPPHTTFSLASPRPSDQLPYRRKFQDKNIGKPVISSLKPQNKDVAADNMSCASTDSSKKPSKGKIGQTNSKEDLEASLDDFQDIIGEIKSLQPRTTRREASERITTEQSFPEITIISCSEGSPLNYLPDYYKRTPKTSNLIKHIPRLNLALKREDIEPFTDRYEPTDRPITNDSCYFDLSKRDPSSRNEAKYPVARVFRSDYANKVSQRSQIQSSKHGIVVLNLMQKFNASECDFEMGNIDEAKGDRRTSLCTPRSVVEYSSRALSKPTSRKTTLANLKLPIKTIVVNNLQPGFARENVRKERAAVTDRICYDDARETTTRFTAPNHLKLASGQLSSVAFDEAMRRYHNHNDCDDVDKEVPEVHETAHNRPKSTAALTPRRQASMAPISDSKNYIPCLLLRYASSSSKIIVYFHGNGEDINLARDLLRHVRDTLKVH